MRFVRLLLIGWCVVCCVDASASALNSIDHGWMFHQEGVQITPRDNGTEGDPEGSAKWTDQPAVELNRDEHAQATGEGRQSGAETGSTDEVVRGGGGVRSVVLNVVMLFWAIVAGAVFVRDRLWRLPGVPVESGASGALVPFVFFGLVVVFSGIGTSLAIEWVIGRDAFVEADTGAAALDLRAMAIMRIGAYIAIAPLLVAYAMMMLQRLTSGRDTGEAWTTGAGPTGARVAPQASGAGRTRRDFGELVRYGLRSFVLWFPIVSSVSVLGSVVARLFEEKAPDPLAHATLRSLIDEPPSVWKVVTIALVVLATPVVEEFMYRGMLQRACRAVIGHRWVGIAVASALFTAMHVTAVPWHALIALFVLSLGFGWSYERSGSLLVPIVMHLCFNGVNVALALVLFGG